MLLDFISRAMNDGLSIFFAFIILLVFVPIFIYSIGYIKEYKKHYSTKYIFAMILLFVASMLGVVFSGHSIVFMIFWELMSITSFFLVIYEYKNKESIKSGIMYFIMTHISGLVLMFMFALIYKYTGSFDFDTIIKMSGSFTYNQKVIIFTLAVVGFGAKAGIVPLHPWLPKAHPAAPSNVSALMSGVMLKVALYGFIRVVFTFLDGLPFIFGILIMVIGTITAIFSILNATVQNDIKKLLAYSSAENIGIIFGTLGITMFFESYNGGKWEVLALTAALFHILNHAVFKSLLFLSAGSVLFATSTKNMNELGGLHKKMKFATICALIGTAAIAAIPPLNGFASEVLIFKSFIVAIGWTHSSWILVIIACGTILALTSGLAIYAAVKSFGMTYLGEARSEKAQNTHKIPISMNIGMAILTIYAILLGILSPLAVKYISNVSIAILKTGDTLTVSMVGFDAIIISSLIVLIVVLIFLINSIANKNEKVEVYETWGCGFNNADATMQYTGSGYTQPITRIAGEWVDYRKSAKIKDTVFLKQKTGDLIEKYLYRPVIKFTDFLACKVTKIQYGKIQLYISYIFAALVITILLVSKFI